MAKRIENHFGEINIGSLDEMQYDATHVHGLNIGDFWIKLPIAPYQYSSYMYVYVTAMHVHMYVYHHSLQGKVILSAHHWEHY